MPFRFPVLVALACATGPAFATYLAEPRSLNDARLEPTECWFEIPSDRQAECAWLYPGDRALDRPVRLPVVRIPGDAEADTSPILHIPGGPGYPAGLDDAGMAQWWNWRDSSRWPQDLILFDPRGTGLSKPGIDCPAIREFDRDTLHRAFSGRRELAMLAGMADRCYRRLGGHQVLSAFTSAAQLRDVGVLMALLGGDDWNLWGVSYGSRIALHAAREYPNRIRTLLLDSVYPPQINGFLSRPAQFERALNQIAAACRAHDRCDRRHPHIATAIQTLLERTGERPIRLDFVRRRGAKPVTLAITDFRLLWMLFFESYLSTYDARAAEAVAAAAAGDETALEPLAQVYLDTLLDPSFSYPVYYSTSCAEDWPQASQAKYQAALTAHPWVAPHLRGDWEHAVCRFWEVASLPAEFHEPVHSKVPSLLLHGERDPATLPEWASTAARTLENAELVVFKGTSHATTFGNHCAMAVAQVFLARPASWRPPACLDKQRARPPAAE